MKRKFIPLEYLAVFIYYVLILIYATCVDYVGIGKHLLTTVAFVLIMWAYVMVVYIIMKRFLSLVLAKVAYLITFGSYLLQSYFMMGLDLAYSIKSNDLIVLHCIVVYILSFIVMVTSLRYYKPLKIATKGRKTSIKSVIIFAIIMMMVLPWW